MDSPSLKDHSGHDLRRGPIVSLHGDTYFACITCQVVGIDFRNKHRATDLPRWTDEDYEANKDWVEAL